MISAVLSYCKNDYKFFEESIAELKKLTDDIIVCYADKSFDGELEDNSDMIKLATGCKLCEIKFDDSKDSKYHHNLFRWVGLKKSTYDYVLFLDGDEIIDGENVKNYVKNNEYKKFDVISFKCYWYFREKNYRAKRTEEAGVLCKKSICTEDYIFSVNERWEFVNRKLNWKSEETFNEKILVNHYSWVRTKEEMIKKVKSWAHKNDKNWLELIEEEFSREFNMTDFVHNYQFEKI